MDFKDMAMCDLRGYNTYNAAKKIKSIKDVALVILPKNMDEKTKEAFASIKMTDVASTIYADDSNELYIFNGDITITDGNAVPGSVILINGMATVEALPDGCEISLMINGAAYIDKSNENKVKILNVNGTVEFVDLKNRELLPYGAVLSDSKFPSDNTKTYFSYGNLIIETVSPEACGKAECIGTIYAHRSVINSKIQIKAKK